MNPVHVSLSIQRSPDQPDSDRKGLFDLTLTDHEHHDDKIAHGVAFLDLHEEEIPRSGKKIKDFLKTFLSGSEGIETDGLNFGRFFLQNLLVDPKISALWSELEKKKRPLRLRLVLPEEDAGVVADLPFELLADESGFLFRRPGSALIRVIRSFEPREAGLAENAPLLVAWANPPDTPPIAPEVFSAHETAAKEVGARARLQANEPCRWASLGALKKHLNSDPKVKLLSLIAHGDARGGSVYLHQHDEPDDKTDGVPVAASDLASALKVAGVEVVFLWSCFGAKHNAVLGSLAATLLNPKEGDVSVVVASHAALAASDTPKVFRAILEEVPIHKGDLEQAVAAGRMAVQLTNLQWAAPAYYSRTKHQSARVGELSWLTSRPPVNPTRTVERAPPPLLHFIGRDDDVARGVALLGAGRLVSVTGSPGMGKTEVALAIARKVAEQGTLSSRTIWLSLGGLETSGLLRARLAIAFGAEPQQCPDDEALSRVIGPSSALLVLDNAEDPLQDDRAGVQALLDGLLRLCPNLRFLLSTRERMGDLRSSGEAMLELAPLSLPDTRSLFLELTGDKLSAPERSSATLDCLLTWLGGHPLSITLVASRVGINSLEKLWSGLTAKGASMVQDPAFDGSRPEAEIARTKRLESCIDLSFGPLSARFPEAAEMFLWLGFFPSGLPAVLVPRVFGEDAGEHRAVLLRKHLAEEVGEDRRLTLPFPLQNYAKKRCPRLPLSRQGELLSASFAALAGWLAYLHKWVGTARSREAVDRALRQEANLSLLLSLVRERPAGNLAKNIGIFLQIWGSTMLYGALLKEANSLKAQALPLFDTPAAQEDNESREGEAMCREFAGDLAKRTAKLVEAEKHYGDALRLYQAIDAKQGEANTQKALGDLAMRTDKLVEAEKHYGDVLCLYQAIDDKLGEANTQKALGDLAMRTAKLVEAEKHYGDALRLYQAIDAKLGEANTLQSLGDLAKRTAKLVEAEKHYGDALRLYQAIDAKQGEANTQKALGDLAMRTDKLVEAEKHYGDALRLYQAIDDKLGEANTQKALGDLAIRTAKLVEAEKHYGDALRLYQAIDDKLGEANTLQSLGDLAMRTDKLVEAEKHYGDALRLYQAIDDKQGEANTQKALGDLAMRTDKLVEAEKHYGDALRLYQAIDDKLGEANTLQSLGDLAMRTDKLVEAEKHYGDALRLYQAIDAKQGEANTQKALGDLAMRTDKLVEAEKHYGDALRLYQAIDDKQGEANTQKALGDLAMRTDKLVEAEKHYGDALRLYQAIDDKLGEANTLQSLGDLAMRTDKLVEAEKHYGDALRLYQAIDAKQGEANTLAGLGNLQAARGKPGHAFSYHLSALELQVQIEDRLGVAASLGYLARDALLGGEPLRAVLLGARCLRELDLADTGFGQMLACEDLRQAFATMKQETGAKLAFMLFWAYAARVGHPVAQEIEQQAGRPPPPVEMLRPMLDELLKSIEEQFADLDPLAPLEPEK